VFSLWKKWSQCTSPPPDSPAETLSYLAAFLGAGLSPASAWREIPPTASGHSVCVAVVDKMNQGFSLAQAVEESLRTREEAWRTLGAAWGVARESGAPLAPTLQALASSLADRDHTVREVRATCAGPRATMRLVMGLPVLGLGGGLITGVNGFHVLFGTPLGLGALGGAGVLMGAAGWWMSILQRDALAQPDPGEIALELFAIATAGGALPEAAWERVQTALVSFDLPGSENSEVSELSELSRRVGVPVSGLARRHSGLMRQRWRTDALERINRLGVQVVIPLGVLVLPAFVLLAVVPLALALWSEAALV
jgi:tight adherence protein B